MRPSPGTSVLVTDGDERASLAVVRSLGRCGYRIIVASESGHSIAGGSRFAQAECRVPNALMSPAEYTDAIEALCSERRFDVVVPITEPSLLALLPERSRFAPAVLPFASSESFRRICDKGEVLRRARAVGISSPTVCEIQGPEDTRRVVAEDSLPYPLVLKPSRSVVTQGDRRGRTAVAYADSRSELERLLAAVPPEAFPILVQRRISGSGTGVFLLIRDGRVLAHFGHRRIREKPPSGGVSVLRESVAVEGSLLERSIALLRAFEWEGVAMVEFKVDRDSGTPYLMEINGRFWGSLQLAVDAGVDFPRLLLETWMGNPPSVPPTYRSGVQSRWFWGDVDHLLLRLRDRRFPLWAFLTGFLPPAREEVIRLSDPVPGWRESRRWLTDVVARRSRRPRPEAG